MSERETLIEVMARGILRGNLEGYASSAMAESILNDHFARWRDGKDDPRNLVHSSAPAVAVRRAEAALTALEAAGVRLVPVEATMEMTHAVWATDLPQPDIHGDYADLDIQMAARDIYRSMLAASPYAPEGTTP